MGVLLTFPVKRLITIIVSILMRYSTNLQKLDLAEIYGSPHLQSGAKLYLRGPTDQQYDEAALYCNKLHADLFHVSNDTNIGMLFSSLGVQRRAIWTGIYRSKSLNTFLDITRYPPITKTPHETIDDSQLSQDSSNAVHSVALQMVGQQLQYVTRDKDDNVNTQTLCTQDIPYPQRVRNIQSLVNIREVFANQVSSSLKSIQEMTKFVEKSVDLMPLAGVEQQTESISSTELSTLEADLASWEAVVDEKANAFTKIKSDLDGVELVVQHNYMMEDLKQIAMKCYQFAAAPLSMVGAQLDGNHTVFRSGDNFIFEKMPATDLATVPTPTPTPSPTLTTPTPMPTPTSPLPTVGPITTQAFTPRVKNTVTPRLIFTTASTYTPTPTTQTTTDWWVEEFFNSNWWGRHLAAWFLYSFYAPTFYEVLNFFISLVIILSMCVPVCKSFYLRRKTPRDELPRVRQLRSVHFEAEQQEPLRPTFSRTLIRSNSAPNTPLLARYFTANERDLNRPASTQVRVHTKAKAKKRAPPPTIPPRIFSRGLLPRK
jgi:hypothetical protein